MGAPDDAKTADEKRRPMCDHICLKDDGHVERGEPHFYGYELPSPRRLAEFARVIAAQHVRDSLPTDLRIAARALRGSSWPGDMAEDMERRANRLNYAADALESLKP